MYRLEAASALLLCMLLRNVGKDETESVYDNELQKYPEETKADRSKVYNVNRLPFYAFIRSCGRKKYKRSRKNENSCDL